MLFRGKPRVILVRFKGLKAKSLLICVLIYVYFSLLRQSCPSKTAPDAYRIDRLCRIGIYQSIDDQSID